MKVSIKFFPMILLSLFAVTHISLAQDAPDTVIRYEKDVPDYENTARELLHGSLEEIIHTGKRLLPPEEGDDTKTRFILTILAKEASRTENAGQREKVEEAFLELLQSAPHDEIKDYLLTQFHLFGSPKSTETLGAFLHHETLYINAAIALLSIGDPSAAPFFVEASADADVEANAMFLRALGDLRYAEGLDVIQPYLSHENDGARLAAMYALSRIGGMQVHDALLQAAFNESELNRPQAPAYVFHYAASLCDEGHGYTAAQIAYDALDRYAQPEHSALQCAALDILVKAKPQYSVYDLMKYADSDLSDVSAAALALAQNIPGKVFMEMWLDKAQHSPDPLKEKIMTMLEEREDYHARFDIVYPPVNLAEPDADGFTPLFNNMDLTGWTGDTRGYIVEDGKIVCLPGGNLYTEREYSDFVLRFEFKLPPGGNNGLGIRTPKGVNAAYHGMELQILDDGHPMYKDIKPWQAHGSIYGVVPAKRGFLRETGQWNQEEVIAFGSRIVIRLNGETIVNADIQAAAKEGTVDGQEHPGLHNPSGYIAFLGHGSRVEFRNIRIKELTMPEEEPTEEEPTVDAEETEEMDPTKQSPVDTATTPTESTDEKTDSSDQGSSNTGTTSEEPQQ